MEEKKKSPVNLRADPIRELNEMEKMQGQIDMLEFKVKYLDAKIQILIKKIEEPQMSTDYGV